MDRVRKIELIQRSLGIRHKLKVHESMKSPDSHEEMALMLMGKWELEDELRAIEELLADARSKNVSAKRTVIQKEGVHTKAAHQAADEAENETGATRRKGKK